MQRVLLLLPSATYRAGDFLDAARALDAEVVVASERRLAIAGIMGGRTLTLDLRHPEEGAQAIADLNQTKPLDAVLAVDDQGLLIASLACTRLGLPHNPPEAVARTRNKVDMREALAAAGVPQPEFRAPGAGADLAAAASEVGFPCVVKPAPLSASRGVIRADDPVGAQAAGARVRAILAEAEEDAHAALIVEGYLPGDEVAVEGLLRAGRLEVLAIFDKPDPMEGPYFEETILVTPSRLPEETRAEITRVTAAAAAALGLREGPVHAELRVQEARAWVLEIAARSIGGLCSRALRFGIGATLEEVILRHALGLSLDGLKREAAASGVMMIPIPKSGLLQEVRGQEEARAVSGIGGLQITIGPGRPVRTLPEGDRYLGFIFARGRTPEEVERALRIAHSRLDIDVA
jgi:biotin carboxylase